jgi:hypothetical protein
MLSESDTTPPEEPPPIPDLDFNAILKPFKRCADGSQLKLLDVA